MSRKRKKPTGSRRPSGAQARTPATTDERPQVPRLLSWLAPPSADSAWPPIGRSLARGFITVGASPITLLSAFGLQFVMWLGLVALGLEGPFSLLVNLLALPPISTYYDANTSFEIFGPGFTGLISTGGFLLVRAVVLGLLTALIVRAYEGEGTIGEALRRGLRVIPVTIVYGLMSMTFMFVGSIVQQALGAGLGLLVSILSLVAALFLFVFAPVLALREPRTPLQEVVRRGVRAALMPGSRHLLMCLLYIFLTLPILTALAPGGVLLGVNPPLATWVYALVCTYVHLSFLAAFAYRLMAVEDEIPDTPVKLRRR
ncbi:MAG TPA: hypothetical protein VFR44_03150 [Actinomycetota bacterium]|nr:hypothetical protein [Actinomycetota bacterium]